MRNIIQILFFIYFSFISNKGNAQQLCASSNTVPQDEQSIILKDNVNKSDAVIEGQIINQFSQWTEGFTDPRGHVYTSVIIRVSKVFKGDIKDTIIELISEGGAYPDGPLKGKRSMWTGGNRYSWIFPGYEGIFFLKENKSDIQSGKNMQSYFYLGGISTAISYNNTIGSKQRSAYYGGKNIEDFENILYKPIEAITGTPRKVIGLMPFEEIGKK